MKVIKKQRVEVFPKEGYVTLMLTSGAKVITTSNSGGIIVIWYEEEAEPLSGYRMPHEVHFYTKGDEVSDKAKFLNLIQVGAVTAMAYVIPPK